MIEMGQLLGSRTDQSSRSGSWRYRRSGRVSQAEHAGHIIVLDPTGARYYGFDEVGARIWTLLEVSHTPEDLVNSIATEYEAPRDQIQCDVRSFLDQLEQAQLIDREEQV